VKPASSTIRFTSVTDLGASAEPSTAGFVPPGFDPGRVAIVERGEAAKSLESLDLLYGRFLELGVGRDWTVVGIGGGSVSDLAGFAASTWLRGIDFGFVPTTLLAMVDASVGGKNGIDFRGWKNLIGCFCQPRFVLVDPGLLSGLPDFDLACGLVEAVKHGIIDGDAHLSAIERAVDSHGVIDRDALGPIIGRSIAFKSAVAEADERETGKRRTLNLGHTVGHGVEAIACLPHGACVATGLAAALGLAIERGGSPDDAGRIIALLRKLGMPVSLEEARKASPESSELSPAVFRDAVALAMASDKKRLGQDVLFAMPMAIGDVRIEPVPLEELRDFVRRMP
jgi:3-dehydroquinate synthase